MITFRSVFFLRGGILNQFYRLLLDEIGSVDETGLYIPNFNRGEMYSYESYTRIYIYMLNLKFRKSLEQCNMCLCIYIGYAFVVEIKIIT